MLILTGKSQKGKNRVRELGPIWKIVEIRDNVAFSTENGPWALIVPANGDKDKSRWVNMKNDKDFEITVSH